MYRVLEVGRARNTLARNRQTMRQTACLRLIYLCIGLQRQMPSWRVGSVEHTKHTITVCSSGKHCIQLHANSINLISIHMATSTTTKMRIALYGQWTHSDIDLNVIYLFIRFYSIAHFLCFIGSQYILYDYIYLVFFPSFSLPAVFSQLYYSLYISQIVRRT